MMLSTAPFAAARPVQAGKAGSPRRVLRCRAEAAQDGTATGAKLAAAGIAAAALLHVAPAYAGVVFEKPNTKKVFQNNATAAAKVVPAAKAAASGAGISLPSLPSFKAPELGLSVGTLAIPAAVVTIGGGFLALSTLDAGFSDFMRGTMVKDSGDYAGYEQALQNGFAKVIKAPKKAVKAVAKTATKEAKKQGFNLPNPFS